MGKEEVKKNTKKQTNKSTTKSTKSTSSKKTTAKPKTTKPKKETPKVVEEIKEKVEEVVTEVKEEVNEIKEEIKEEIVEAKEEVKEVIETVQEKKEEITSEVSEEAPKKEKKKFKVNKKVLYTILTILVIIGGYLGFKAFCLKYYNITSDMSSYEIENYGDFVKAYAGSETWTLKYKTIDKDASYLKFKNVLIRDDFSQFKIYDEISTGDYIKYVLYDEKEEVVASFWMGVTDTYVNMLKTTVDVFGTEDRRVKNFDKEDFLDDNEITTDLELFEYLVDNHGFEHDLLTPVVNMQKDYTIDFLSYIMLPRIDHLTLLEGEFTGYILNLDNNIKEVSLLYKGKRYTFTFIGEKYFTDEYVKDLLDTIVID